MVRHEQQPILAVNVNRILFTAITCQLMSAFRRCGWNL